MRVSTSVLFILVFAITKDWFIGFCNYLRLVYWFLQLPKNGLLVFAGNWASEASPTLGCSIEISRDIYMYRSVCLSCPKCVGGITWPTRMVNKTDL